MINEKKKVDADFLKRKEYVESLNKALAPLPDFYRIEYARAFMTDEEFVKISDLIGNALFMDITELPLAEVLREISKYVLVGEYKGTRIFPRNVISDLETKRKVAPLFKAEVAYDIRG